MKRTGKSMLEIIVRRYAEQSRLTQRWYEIYMRSKSEGDRQNWYAHREQWWELREALEEYGFSPEECDKMEQASMDAKAVPDLKALSKC
jgi:hypothetical protein